MTTDEHIAELRHSDEAILETLRRIEKKLDATGRPPVLMSVPDAARHLNISYGRLLTLCKNGTVPAGSKSERNTYKHYLVDVHAAAEVLSNGGADLVTERKFKSNHKTKKQ